MAACTTTTLPNGVETPTSAAPGTLGELVDTVAQSADAAVGSRLPLTGGTIEALVGDTLLTLQSIGNVGLILAADTDNTDENDVPSFAFTKDGGGLSNTGLLGFATNGGRIWDPITDTLITVNRSGVNNAVLATLPGGEDIEIAPAVSTTLRVAPNVVSILGPATFDHQGVVSFGDGFNTIAEAVDDSLQYSSPFGYQNFASGDGHVFSDSTAFVDDNPDAIIHLKSSSLGEFGGFKVTQGANNWQMFTTDGTEGGGTPTNAVMWAKTNQVSSGGTLLLQSQGDLSIVKSAKVGSTALPDASLVLDVESTTKAARPAPRMTEAQRDAISNPLTGAIVDVIESNRLERNIGTPGTPDWRAIDSPSFSHEFPPDIGAANQFQHPHGRPYLPTNALVKVVCKTAEHGYSVGDEVHFDLIDKPRSFTVDATNLTIAIGGGSVTIIPKTGGGTVSMTEANWAFKIYWQ